MKTGQDLFFSMSGDPRGSIVEGDFRHADRVLDVDVLAEIAETRTKRVDTASQEIGAATK